MCDLVQGQGPACALHLSAVLSPQAGADREGENLTTPEKYTSRFTGKAGILLYFVITQVARFTVQDWLPCL